MPLIFAILGPCALLWFCAPGGGLSQLTAQSATPPPVVRWQMIETTDQARAATLAGQGWEPYAATHHYSGLQTYYLRHRAR